MTMPVRSGPQRGRGHDKIGHDEIGHDEIGHREARMRAMPLSIGTMHFVGIGGIGMSGIAEVLHTLGYRVQGSDISEFANVQRLREAGIKVAIGHDAANLGDAQVVIVSTAVKRDNPEVAAARARLIPVVRRAEMLAELMRLKWSIAVGGTHGKTTTTSLIAAVLEAAKLDPTVINGGIINAYGSNTRLGAGDWMVVEADESDGSFLRLPAVIAVVTNMDPEHLDHWGTAEAMIAGYDQFVANIPFYGFAVLCIDHPAVQQMIPRLSDHRIVTYGFSPQADVRAERMRTDKLGCDVRGYGHRPRAQPGAQDGAVPPADAGPAQRAERAGRHRRRHRDGDRRRHAAQRASLAFSRRQAALHQDRRDRRHHRDRRLRPPSGGDRGGAEGGAAGRRARRGRGGAAAPLYAAAFAVRRILHLHERRRHGDRCRCVSGRGDADRRASIATRWWRVCARAAIAAWCRCRAQGGWPRWCTRSPSPAISWFVSVPVRSPNGLRRCQASSRRCRLGLGRQAAGRSAAADGSAGVCWEASDDGSVDRSWPLDALPPLRGRVQADAPLAPFTWFRVGGAAEVLIRPADEADLAQFLAALPRNLPMHVLGACSNLIIRDGGLPGVSIRLARGFDDDHRRSRWGDRRRRGAGCYGSGACGRRGTDRPEFLSGIPGSIGGAVAMNAGAYGGDVASVLDWAEIVSHEGTARRLSAPDLAFAYRHAAPAGGGRRHPREIACAARRPGGDRGAHGGHPHGTRGLAAGSRPHRRVHVPQSAARGQFVEGVGTDRCRRLQGSGEGRRCRFARSTAIF